MDFNTILIIVFANFFAWFLLWQGNGTIDIDPNPYVAPHISFHARKAPERNVGNSFGGSALKEQGDSEYSRWLSQNRRPSKDWRVDYDKKILKYLRKEDTGNE